MGLAKVSTMCSQDSAAVSQVWGGSQPRRWSWARGAGETAALGSAGRAQLSPRSPERLPFREGGGF